jgi:hypothetical protein
MAMNIATVVIATTAHPRRELGWLHQFLVRSDNQVCDQKEGC